MERLFKGKAWVVLTFSDGTKQSVYTTLCPDVFKELCIVQKEHAFYDINHNQYVPFREDAVDIEVFDNKPIFEQEVLNFASRFI